MTCAGLSCSDHRVITLSRNVHYCYRNHREKFEIDRTVQHKGDCARTRASDFKDLPAVILSIFGEYTRFLINSVIHFQIFCQDQDYIHSLDINKVYQSSISLLKGANVHTYSPYNYGSCS